MEPWSVPAVVVRLVDADTIVVDLDLGWRVFRNNEHIRVYGLNSPERGTEAGRLATLFGRNLLPVGTNIRVISMAKPSFERTIGRVLLPDGRDYSAEIIAAGHGVYLAGSL